MAGILDTLKQSNDERLAQQSALVKTPMQSVGVAARGAVNDVGAIVAAPMIGVAGVAKDAYEGLKNFGAGFTGLKADAPAAPPKVITPTTTNTAADVSAAAQKTIDATPMVPTAAPDKFDAAVAAATKGNYTAQTAPQAIGVSAPVAAPVAAKPAAMPQVAMNPALVNMQQQLMGQFQNAQDVVSQGSNRDGYKMGDVTKALGMMQNLNTAMSSVNNLTGQTYGADTGMVNHAADNAARTNIANAGNQTELQKTQMTGQFGVDSAKVTANSALTLAERKAVLEAQSPAGIKALVEAETGARNLADTAHLTGVDRVRGVQGKATDYQQVKDAAGVIRGRMVDGKYVPLVENEINQITPPRKK